MTSSSTTHTYLAQKGRERVGGSVESIRTSHGVVRGYDTYMRLLRVKYAHKARQQKGQRLGFGDGHFSRPIFLFLCLQAARLRVSTQARPVK